MAKNNKAYGFTIALWEVPETCPNLFRAVDDFRLEHNIPSTGMWRAMIEPTWQPWPIRRLRGWLGLDHVNLGGDQWNLCHYWSNFEIADLDFFRGAAYQRLFEHLDKSGGFYYERVSSVPKLFLS
jgi:mannosyltransferase